MKIAKTKLIAIIAGVVAALAIGGVVIYNVTKPKEEPVVKTEKKVEDNTHKGEMRSLLTGEWVPEEQGKKRPVSVMTENIPVAMPQYGLNKAGVIYECPMEGGLTRLMAIYEDYSGLDKIGNVRSCRPYFAYFAGEFDSVYVHFGQSVYALEVLESGLVNNISGLDGSVSSTFYRTDDRKAPHNAYVSEQGIKEGIAKKGYREEYDANYPGHYLFVEDGKENNLDKGTDCKALRLYYPSNTPSFVYDDKTKTYKRFQYGEAQIDKVDEKQIEVKNIILQNVISDVYDSPEGYLNLTVSGSGEGKYITNGKMIDVTWTKSTEDGITHYYDSNNKEIQLNPGKTWVSIIQNQYADRNVFSATVDGLE